MLLIVAPALCLFLCLYLLWQALMRERELRSELASLRAVRSELESTLASTRDELDITQADLARVRAAYEQRGSNMDASVTHYNEWLGEVYSMLDVYVDRAVTAEGQCEDLTSELQDARNSLDSVRDELDTTSREVLKLRGDLLDAHRAYEERCSLHQNAMRHATAEQDSLHAWVQRLVVLHTSTSSSYMALLRLRNSAVDDEYHDNIQQAQIRVLLQMVDGRDAEIAATSNAFLTRLREWNQI